jgi:predicted HTH transcriptional regulator
MAGRLNDDDLSRIVKRLIDLPTESGWFEFKKNNENPEAIGKYISALSNTALLHGAKNGFLIWGIDDGSHEIVGTTFKPCKTKKGNEDLMAWLNKLVSPQLNFEFFEFTMSQKSVVLLRIPAASKTPVKFMTVAYVRIGSYNKKLGENPEKEKQLWRLLEQKRFEEDFATEKSIAGSLVLQLLDYPAYFELLDLPLPDEKAGILSALESDDMIACYDDGNWHITNLGAILFAKKLSSFKSLKRKAVRVVLYNGKNRLETIREQEGGKGYASGFEGLIDFILNQIPTNEVIGDALRKEAPMLPKLAIRELVANAIIHQDFYERGTGPMIEIFSNRIEITNPGIPLVRIERFLDSPPKSRNEALAAFLRRVGVCEERGSGIDKVVYLTEKYQLPAPIFEMTDEHTKVTLFAHQELRDMDSDARIRACYLHACLHYVQKEFMTNSTLRERFQIPKQNSATVSRIIKMAVAACQIKCHDETVGNKGKKYVPFWA